MSSSPRFDKQHRWAPLLISLLLLGLTASVSGCGLLGGGGDEEEQKYPEPPGRPSAAMVEGSSSSGSA